MAETRTFTLYESLPDGSKREMVCEGYSKKPFPETRRILFSFLTEYVVPGLRDPYYQQWNSMDNIFDYCESTQCELMLEVELRTRTKKQTYTSRTFENGTARELAERFGIWDTDNQNVVWAEEPILPKVEPKFYWVAIFHEDETVKEFALDVPRKPVVQLLHGTQHQFNEWFGDHMDAWTVEPIVMDATERQILQSHGVELILLPEVKHG